MLKDFISCIVKLLGKLKETKHLISSIKEVKAKLIMIGLLVVIYGFKVSIIIGYYLVGYGYNNVNFMMEIDFAIRNFLIRTINRTDTDGGHNYVN
ncbi:MAG: hypothetical protein AB9856_00085 [Cellulosilyticaceae bacterium]